MITEILGFPTRMVYLGALGLLALQRVWELLMSRRHAARLRHRGAMEYGARHYPWMVVLHTSFLISCAAEPFVATRPFSTTLFWTALLVLLAAQMLRLWTIQALGERWTTRVLVLPDTPPIETGPYRFTRHPTYLAVVAEIAAVPMLHSAWATALVFSILNLIMVSIRVETENTALTGATARTGMEAS